MIGVSGSGKSTVVAEIAKETGAEIVSSDAIRGEIYGDENCQANPARVFEIVHKRVQKALREGRDVIMGRDQSVLQASHGLSENS